jgi:3-dehydroquinate dehydratase-1
MREIRVHGKAVGGGEKPLICTPLVGRTGAEILDELATILPKRPHVLEWRVDYFEGVGNTALVIDIASLIKQQAGEIPIIFTCRSMNEGGEGITLDDEDILKLYVAACASRCIDLIHYELSSAPEKIAHLREASRNNDVALILSYHNFKRTPRKDELVAKFAEAERLGADVMTIGVMANEAEDVLTVLAATQQASRKCKLPVVGTAMGPVGSLSRVFGWLYGSALTFAVGKGASAPGQLSIEDLRASLALARAAVAAGAK